MIKLERNFTPDFFTRMDLESLTQDFKDNGTSVWHHPEIKAACLKLSHGKCAFCEVKLDEASTYNEVEHFKDKKKFPDDVIRWENLLPSCRHCNGSKQRHNVVLEPIINPCNDLPSEHLYMKGYRVKGRTVLGIQTVDVLNFNHREHKFIPRCKAGEVIESSIDDAIEKLNFYLANPSTRRKNILMNLVEAILNECQKTAPFSAVSASMLHRSVEYAQLRESMQIRRLWTDYMQELHEDSLSHVLSSVK
ncbi:TPA: HNH endonuclease [Citrobacter werkmanii]